MASNCKSPTLSPEMSKPRPKRPSSPTAEGGTLGADPCARGAEQRLGSWARGLGYTAHLCAVSEYPGGLRWPDLEVSPKEVVKKGARL